jgi:hypothetical protein
MATGKAQSAKDSQMAADLKARGIYHGKRLSKGLDNIPKMSDVGSAAYRRLRHNR